MQWNLGSPLTATVQTWSSTSLITTTLQSWRCAFNNNIITSKYICWASALLLLTGSHNWVNCDDALQSMGICSAKTWRASDEQRQWCDTMVGWYLLGCWCTEALVLRSTDTCFHLHIYAIQQFENVTTYKQLSPLQHFLPLCLPRDMFVEEDMKPRLHFLRRGMLDSFLDDTDLVRGCYGMASSADTLLTADIDNINCSQLKSFW